MPPRRGITAIWEGYKPAPSKEDRRCVVCRAIGSCVCDACRTAYGWHVLDGAFQNRCRLGCGRFVIATCDVFGDGVTWVSTLCPQCVATYRKSVLVTGMLCVCYCLGQGYRDMKRLLAKYLERAIPKPC